MFKLEKRNRGFDNDYVLIIGGRALKSSEVSEDGGKWDLAIEDEAEVKYFADCPLREIQKYFESASLRVKVDWSEHLYYANISFAGEAPQLSLWFDMELDQWANPYSIADYLESLRLAVEKHGYSDIQLGADTGLRDESFEFTLECSFRSSNAILGDELDYWTERARVICTRAQQHRLENIHKESVTAFFVFPPAVRAACKQYLLYFVQFLQDLGINADSEMKEDAERVLFSVTPRDGPSALGRIREALEAYLELPRNPEFRATADRLSDMAVAQLKSNVFFLQSQLELVKATIQAKDAAIQALDFMVFQQRQLLTGGAIAGQADESKLANDDEEPILGDAVHVTTYEGKGFKVNLPHILRQLKRRFGRGQEKSGSQPALPPARDPE